MTIIIAKHKLIEIQETKVRKILSIDTDLKKIRVNNEDYFYFTERADYEINEAMHRRLAL